MNIDIMTKSDHYSYILAKTMIPKSEGLFSGFFKKKEDDYRTKIDKKFAHWTDMSTKIIDATILIIKHLIKFILHCIAEIVKQTGLIDKLLYVFYKFLNLDDIARGESSNYPTIRNITEPREIIEKISLVRELIENREKVRKSIRIKDNIDRLNVVLDPSITDNGKLLNDRNVEDMIVNEAKYQSTTTTIYNRFEKYLSETNVNGWSIYKTIDCTYYTDRVNTLQEYKNITESFKDELSLVNKYFKGITQDFEVLVRNVQSFERNANYSQRDTLLINILQPIIGYLVQDINNIANMTKWIKNELVSNMMTLTDNKIK